MDYLRICLTTLLPHKQEAATSNTKINKANIKYNSEMLKRIKDIKNYLDATLPVIRTDGLPTGEPYYLIVCNCYVGTIDDALDNDNIDYSKTINHIIKTLRFIPDDSPDFLSVILTGAINSHCMNKWVEKHISPAMGEHSELFFIPQSKIATVFS